MNDEYPKKMQAGVGTVVTVVAEPNEWGSVPVRYPDGRYVVVNSAGLSPLPSPDDIVEVTVKMTRADRDHFAAELSWITQTGRLLHDGCRAHRDAEEVGP